MPKIRVVITGVMEFDPDTLCEGAYEPGATIEGKLAVELDNARQAPLDYILLDDMKLTVSGEVLP